MRAYRALSDEAERQGLRVKLGHAERRGSTRLARLAIEDREGNEVGALRLTSSRSLEKASVALLRLLEHRAAEAGRKV